MLYVLQVGLPPCEPGIQCTSRTFVKKSSRCPYDAFEEGEAAETQRSIASQRSLGFHAIQYVAYLVSLLQARGICVSQQLPGIVVLYY